MAKPQKTLLIPTEIKSRDLYGRLYLGQKAVKRGYKVFIGRSKILHKQLPDFPRGIILEDDATYQCRDFVKKASEMRYAIATIDEESIAVSSDRRYVIQRIHYPNLERALVHFTRGEGDKDQIIKDAKDAGKLCTIVPAGNPRIDILREKNIDLHLAESPHEWDPADVITVMSRFSRSNPFSVDRQQIRKVLRRKFDFTDEQFADFVKYLDHTDNLFDLFWPMVEKIPALFPDKQIVFRPHPSENFQFWEDIAARYDNAHCIHTGTAVQWSINSCAMVQTGCTTAIESALLGANVLAYCPITSEDYDISLPNLVSKVFETEDEVFAELAKAPRLTTEARLANAHKAREFLSTRMAGCLEQESCDIMLDSFDRLDWQPPKNNISSVMEDLKWKLRFMRDVYKAGKKTPKAKKEINENYHQQKFPDTDISEIRSILDKFGAQDVKIRQFKKNWWELY